MGRVAEWRWRPRRYSPLVGVVVDEDGEEDDEVDKVVAVAKIGEAAKGDKRVSAGTYKTRLTGKRWRVIVISTAKAALLATLW